MLTILQQQAEEEKHYYEAAWLLHMRSDTYRYTGQPHLAYQMNSEALQRLQLYLAIGKQMQQVLQSLLDDVEESSEAQIPFVAVKSLLASFAEQANMFSSITHPQPEVAPTLPSLLTTRELEVLQLLARGLTNQQIADHLVVSLATAKKHVANILGKLGVENRVQAIASAREYKLL
jgi:LuxR family maltose regulon positive regulatory protein